MMIWVISSLEIPSLRGFYAFSFIGIHVKPKVHCLNEARCFSKKVVKRKFSDMIGGLIVTKSFYKKGDIVLVRIQVIQHCVKDTMKKNDIAFKYGMHRNTICAIMHVYESLAPPEFRKKIESGDHFSLEELQSSLCSFLVPRSRKPRSHSKQASKSEEEKILADFWQVKVGAKKLLMILGRKKEQWNFTLGKVRGIYKRNHLRVQKVRTKNGETRSLYNYEAIWAFEDTHYDTKEIADAKSLPKEIYENLKFNEHLPIYEWNFIDVASRCRFTAYSRGKSSTFWLQFLVYVLSHLRYCGIIISIRVHTDGWAEFFSGSERKQQEWNDILKELDAYIDCYNPNWDIRKNLIERSHRSDDEEFLIPFGGQMKTMEQFMTQTQEYGDYWNFKRGHSGKGMHGKTPEEKLLSLWIYQARKILTFQVLNLDRSFYLLQEHLEYFQFQRLLRNIPKGRLTTERKTVIDLVTKYSHLKDYAQNVLTYYQIFQKNLSKKPSILPYLSFHKKIRPQKNV